MGLITNMRSRMQVVMWTILVLFVTSMAIGGLVGGASITDIFGGRLIEEFAPQVIQSYFPSLNHSFKSLGILRSHQIKNSLRYT